MAKVFISYKRDPSFSLAKLISEKLKQADIDVFLDVERMDSAGPFPKRLLREIESADIFICLLANSTLDAPWVLREIEHAYTMRKPMIPVFQESYVGPTEPLSHAIATLLDFQGVPVLDKRGLFVDESIAKLGRMVKETAVAQAIPLIIDTDDIDTEPIASAPTADDDPTQIGDRTFNLRPQPKSRRWLWLVVALLIIVLGIFLFQWVNGPIISAGVAGTQTAIAMAGGVTETPPSLLLTTDMPNPSQTLTATLMDIPSPTTSISSPTATCVPTPTPSSATPILVIATPGVYIRSVPNIGSEFIIDYAENQRLPLTGVSVDDSYYRVDFNGQVGWILNTGGLNVEIEGDLNNVTTGWSLAVGEPGVYVRSEPNIDSEFIVEYVENQYMLLTGITADSRYYRVDFNGQVGWILNTGGLNVEIEGDLSAVTVVDNGIC